MLIRSVLYSSIITLLVLLLGGSKSRSVHHLNRTKRIINGWPGSHFDTKAHAHLEITDVENEVLICGGTLITQRYVLTAGHCLLDYLRVLVILGSTDYRNRATTIRLISQEAIMHEDHYETFNDIGVVRLPIDVHLTNTVQLARLPRLRDIFNDMSMRTGYICGAGLIAPPPNRGGAIAPNQIMCTNMYVDYGACLHYNLTVLPSELCMSGVWGCARHCQGDSGGGFLIENRIVVGIMTTSLQNFHPHWPSLYTKVASYLPWITANTDAVMVP